MELWADRSFVLKKVATDGLALEEASEELQGDQAMVLAAVKKNGLALQYASDDLKSDLEVVLPAVQDDGAALQYAAEPLKAEREVVLEAVRNDGTSLQFAAETMRGDQEVVTAALREILLRSIEAKDKALKFTWNPIQGNRAALLAQLKSRLFAEEERLNLQEEDAAKPWAALSQAAAAPELLDGALDALGADEELILACMPVGNWALQYAADSLKGNKEFVLSAVKCPGFDLKYAPASLKADREVVLAAVEKFGPSFRQAATALKADKAFVLTVVAKFGPALEMAAEPLRSDLEVILAAIKKDARALKCVPGAALAERPALLAVADACPGLRGVGTVRDMVVFEGRILEEDGAVCIASFPGAYLKFWKQLVQGPLAEKCGAACVFLPKADPKNRFGQHVHEEGEEDCMCQVLYGAKKSWGCAWFEAWKENVEKAARRSQRLIVVHYPFERGQGLVPWDQLKSTGKELWNRVGLGGSQKVEAAYLLKHHPKLVEHVDLLDLQKLLPGFEVS